MGIQDETCILYVGGIRGIRGIRVERGRVFLFVRSLAVVVLVQRIVVVYSRAQPAYNTDRMHLCAVCCVLCAVCCDLSLQPHSLCV